MGKGGGRPGNKEVWEHYTKLQGVEVMCNYCGHSFSAGGGTTRMESHINKQTGKGVRPCSAIIPRSNNEAKDQERIQIDSSFVSNSENEDLQGTQYGSEHSRLVGNKGVQLHTSDDETDDEAESRHEDLQVLQYVFQHLRSGDNVFISSLLYLTQEEFLTLVKPEALLDSLVIDTFAEILTHIERNKKITPSNWYLPVTFSTAALKSDEDTFKRLVYTLRLRENYMSEDLNSCENMFIPVHIQLNPNGGHFYLYVIHLKNKEIEIWDPLPNTSVDDRDETTEKLLNAMEKLLEIKFTEFELRKPADNDILLQRNGFDCGVFVMNFMEQSDNYVKRNPKFQYDSKKEREDLALKLLKSDLNQEKQNLYKEARRCCAEVEKKDGNKRLRVDTSDGESGNRCDDLRNGPTQSASVGSNSISINKRNDAPIFSGQIQPDAVDQERIQVGSSSVSSRYNEDLQVIQYVFEHLSPEDNVFIAPLSHLTQKEFITLIKPEAFLDSLVIDAFAEILTHIERNNKTTPSNWYLPTAALGSDEDNFKHLVRVRRLRENYMSQDLNSCEKMFIPVHIQPKPNCGHFYLYIIHLKNKEIEIWDPLPNTSLADHHETTTNLLRAMGKLFDNTDEEVFTKLEPKMADGILLQPNGFDCGVFVVNFMEQSDNYVKRNPKFQYDSKKEREDLALKLLKSDLNQEKQNLYKEVRRCCAEVEKKDGNKRSRDDTSDAKSDLQKGPAPSASTGTFRRINELKHLPIHSDMYLHDEPMWDWAMAHQQGQIQPDAMDQ